MGTDTVPFILVIDYTLYSGSFDILQAKVNCHMPVGPARAVPRALNKHYSARCGPISVSFMYATQGWSVNIVGKFHDPRVVWW